MKSLAVAALCALAVPAHAACPSTADVALMAARHANLQPAPNPRPGMTMADALANI